MEGKFIIANFLKNLKNLLKVYFLLHFFVNQHQIFRKCFLHCYKKSYCNSLEKIKYKEFYDKRKKKQYFLYFLIFFLLKIKEISFTISVYNLVQIKLRKFQNNCLKTAGEDRFLTKQSFFTIIFFVNKKNTKLCILFLVLKDFSVLLKHFSATILLKFIK